MTGKGGGVSVVAAEADFHGGVNPSYRGEAPLFHYVVAKDNS